MLKPVKKRFDLTVNAANGTVTKTFELEKNIKFITGLLFTANRDDLLYYRGMQKVEINKNEYFPENYESKLLMTGINVPPNNRYFYFKEKVNVGNGSVKVVFTDTDDGRTVFADYRVSLYLDCEQEDI